MSDPKNELVELAAENNADLYAAMFDAHGKAYSRTSDLFIAADTPPPFYSDVTILKESATSRAIKELSRVRNNRGTNMSLKDSFNTFPDSSDLRLLFRASWMLKDPTNARAPTGWSCVHTASELASWEAGWKANGSPTSMRMFPDHMLLRDDLFFWGKWSEGRIEAGCIANLSAACVGLSNVFGPIDCFSDAAQAVASVHPSLPVVGYERGKELEAAKSCGFEDIGTLRVLVSTD